MPRTIEIDGLNMSVATEAELLAFANSIRRAGGADMLEALLPSHPQKASQCLIANALNFRCTVGRGDRTFKDGSVGWAMYLSDDMTDAQRRALNKVKGVRLLRCGHTRHYCLTLPKHIGNAAWAFDRGLAFRSYAVGSYAS